MSLSLSLYLFYPVRWLPQSRPNPCVKCLNTVRKNRAVISQSQRWKGRLPQYCGLFYLMKADKPRITGFFVLSPLSARQCEARAIEACTQVMCAYRPAFIHGAYIYAHSYCSIVYTAWACHRTLSLWLAIHNKTKLVLSSHFWSPLTASAVNILARLQWRIRKRRPPPS